MAVDSTTQAIRDILPALASAEDAHRRMQSGPQHIASFLEDGFDKTTSFSANFGFLVEHLQTFIKIVDELSEVSLQYLIYYMIFNY